MGGQDFLHAFLHDTAVGSLHCTGYNALQAQVRKDNMASQVVEVSYDKFHISSSNEVYFEINNLPVFK